MADEPSQEELLKQQKANCIFCKIVDGQMPSTRVYEDDKLLAILDINPACTGHTLVLTKEHYPIMPLIPPDEFEHLFGTTAALSGAVRDAMLAKRCTVFIANGAIAGQQSPHFLFHLIPREENDGLDVLNIPKLGINQSDVAPLLKQNLYAVMRQHLTKTGKLDLLQVGALAPETKQAPVPEQRVPSPERPELERGLENDVTSLAKPFTGQAPAPSMDQLALVIEQNPELQALLMNNPEKLEGILKQNPEFQSLFGGVDLKLLGERLRQAHLGVKHSLDGVQPTPSAPTSSEPHSAAASPSQTLTPVKPAREMPLNELFAFIDHSRKLRDLILKAPEELKRLIPENERLSTFFTGSNPDAIIKAYQEHAQQERAKNGFGENDDVTPAREMTIAQLCAYIDGKPKLKRLMIEDPEGLKKLIPQNARLQRFFDGSNVNAIIQAYQEHAKAHDGVRVTVEPDEQPTEKHEERKERGVTRDQAAAAWEEVWDKRTPR